jgi:hypothetical protein
VAKNALEKRVFRLGRDAGRRLLVPCHLNGMECHGLAGVERSVALYRAVLSDLRIAVQEQLVDDDRPASRYVISGAGRGRRVGFEGITMSRLENGLVVEDWSVTDTFGMLQESRRGEVAERLKAAICSSRPRSENGWR